MLKNKQQANSNVYSFTIGWTKTFSFPTKLQSNKSIKNNLSQYKFSLSFLMHNQFLLMKQNNIVDQHHLIIRKALEHSVLRRENNSSVS